MHLLLQVNTQHFPPCAPCRGCSYAEPRHRHAVLPTFPPSNPAMAPAGEACAALRHAHTRTQPKRPRLSRVRVHGGTVLTVHAHSLRGPRVRGCTRSISAHTSPLHL